MAAHKGNQYWKNRTTHGRDKIFSDPNEFREAAYEYFKNVDENPIIKHDVIKGGPNAGDDVEIKLQRPYSIEGLCVFLGISRQTFINYERNSQGKEGSYVDFFEVFTHIREIIELNQLEGAAVNVFNSSIIARKLGLVDKKDHKSSDGSMTPKSTYNIIVQDEESEDLLENLEKKLNSENE